MARRADRTDAAGFERSDVVAGCPKSIGLFIGPYAPEPSSGRHASVRCARERSRSAPPCPPRSGPPPPGGQPKPCEGGCPLRGRFFAHPHGRDGGHRPGLCPSMRRGPERPDRVIAVRPSSPERHDRRPRGGVVVPGHRDRPRAEDRLRGPRGPQDPPGSPNRRSHAARISTSRPVSRAGPKTSKTSPGGRPWPRPSSPTPGACPGPRGAAVDRGAGGLSMPGDAPRWCLPRGPRGPPPGSRPGTQAGKRPTAPLGYGPM
jgi:hypothetical protein